MLLRDKVAVVYGGGGAVGGAVARAFGREGARVFLAGRTASTLDVVAKEIGPAASTAEVDVLDEEAVYRHADAVVADAGRIDVTFNAVLLNVGTQGVPLIEMSVTEFVEPITAYLRAQFATARAAAGHMVRQGSGVILPLSNPMAGAPTALAGVFGAAGAGIENLTSQLAGELGGQGVRVVCVRPTGMPETAQRLGSGVRDMWTKAAERLGVAPEEMFEAVGAGTKTGRPLTVEDVANVVAFVASDRAAGLTGTVANVTAGAIPD